MTEQSTTTFRPGRTDNIGRLLNPSSVVVIGASAKPGSVAANVVRSMTNAGYRGPVHLVGRGGGEIDGHTIVTDLDDVPDDLDLAVLALPAEAVRATLGALARKRVKSVLCFASGFAELGEEGRLQQEDIAAFATQSGIALLGPNTAGFQNNADRFHAMMVDVGRVAAVPDRPGVAVLAQSGSLGSHVAESLEARGVPIAYAIPTGNEAQLSVADFIAYAGADERVGVVIVYAEQIRSADDFLAAVRIAGAHGKRVVVLHSGRSEAGQQATSSHTGALAGDNATMRVVARRAGAVVVNTLEELIDVGQLLLAYPNPPGGGMGIIAGSGAICALALDQCDDLGVDVPALSPDSTTTLEEQLAAFMSARNPLDVGTLSGWKPEILDTATRTVLSERSIGALMLAMPAATTALTNRWLEAYADGREGSDKPAIFVVQSEDRDLGPEVREVVDRRRIVLLRSPERALRALAYATTPPSIAAGTGEHSDALRLPELSTGGAGPQPEWLGKEVLRRVGIAVPPGELARTPEEAVQIAGRIGYPVVLKAQAGALAHKSDAGGVLVGVNGDHAVLEGWRTIHDNVAAYRSDIALDGIIVEAQAKQGLELVVGGRRDPQWGPVTMVGLGGIWIEALGDVRLLAPDLPREEIREEIRQLKAAKVLAGIRGSAAVDVDAVADTVAAVGRLLVSRPDITEIDINPLIAYPEGEGVLALDALVVTGVDTGNEEG